MQKAAFIAICGSPNVGKSTILNQIIGTKLSIVSPKVQTTRTTLKAIYNQGDSQLVFVDTPGIFTPTKKLETAIVKTAWSGLDGIDMVLLVIDAVRGICSDTDKIISEFIKLKIKPILLINKKDMVTTEKLNRLTKQYSNSKNFEKVLTVSALKNDGINHLLQYLISKSPNSKWYFPKEQMTTSPLRVVASEITREKLFLNLSDELPYNLTVETESWEKQKDGSIKVNQVIFVTKNSHKQIVLGCKGQMIKKIGILAREEIGQLADCKIHLFLFVKVRDNWFSDPERYKYLEMQQPEKKKNK